jgi:hypothetical protein
MCVHTIRIGRIACGVSVHMLCNLDFLFFYQKYLVCRCIIVTGLLVLLTVVCLCMICAQLSLVRLLAEKKTI